MRQSHQSPNPLLITKLHIPQPRRNLVPRPGLIERLNQVLTCKLTLIAAPAGFGKTTLLSQWLSERMNASREGGTPSGGQVMKSDQLHPSSSPGAPRSAVLQPSQVAWVSLDKNDNDPTWFWTYLIAALETMQTGLSENVQGWLDAPQSPIEAHLTPLINALTIIPDDFVLVLDDYDVIEVQPIHTTLNFLLDHIPPNLHLVIASRADPPLPLARLRLRGELTELRAADLSFTPDEATTFLNGVMGLNLSPDDLAALAARTEGWIAGLQAAALSMQGHEDIHSFIQAFTGNHRYILDYLVEEVLQQQPEDMQTFLLQTAILDRLSGPLCDAVLGKAEGGTPVAARGQVMKGEEEPEESSSFILARASEGSPSALILEQLEQANLFTFPLDEERHWYRYHHLFADLLRKRLQETRPDCVPQLHRRAAEWYEQNSWPDEAVPHAIAAQDFSRAARLIVEQAQAMIKRGEVAKLSGWLEALPADLVRSSPPLSLASAWVRLVIGAFDAVEPPLREAELALNRHADEAPLEAQQARAEIDAIRATVAISQGKIAQGTELVHRSLQKLPDNNPLLRSVLAYSLGMAHRSRGDTHAARQAFAEAQSLSEADDSLLTALLAIHNLAGLQIEEGRLHQAVELYQHALNLVEQVTGDQTLPIAGNAHVGLGKVLLEWNELDAAQQHLEKSIELAKQEGGLGAAGEGYIALAFLYQAQGDEASALWAMQQAEEYFGYSPYPNAAAILSDFRARLALAQGDLAAAQHWAQAHQLHIEDKLSYENKRRYLSLARLLLAQQQFEPAQKLLARLRQLAEAAGWMSSLIETLLLQALTYQAQRKTSEAIMALQHALSLAEPEGYIRIFVVEGEPMRLLLAHCRVQIADQSPRLHLYLDKLLSAFQPRSEAASLPSSSPPLLIEPLSERELEVLRLMTSGASNQEIAEELTIALTTAKKHVSNIIGKLGVSNRTQVVTRVHDLGLLMKIK